MAKAGDERERHLLEPRGVKPLAIVNPQAGSGRAGKMLAELRPIVERALGSVDVTLTERPGHAIDVAREAALAGRELVIAVGGDGTLSEVAGGVLEAKGASEGGTAVGYVGLGTGGDFRRSLGLEDRLDRYLAAIASGRERRIDACRATFASDGGEASRWFINVLSVGVGGLVVRYVAGTSRALPPRLAYVAATVRAVAESEPLSIRCTLHRDGAREERILPAYALAVASGGWFGAGMRVAPQASIDDGLLDVVVMMAPSRLAFLALGAKVYTGAHLGEAGVTSLRCDAIDLALDAGSKGRRALLDIDGEPLGSLPARVQIAPGALRIRA
jgi:YegS/Rv2252/BmrU family lipid kinase